MDAMVASFLLKVRFIHIDFKSLEDNYIFGTSEVVTQHQKHLSDENIWQPCMYLKDHGGLPASP